MSADLGGSSARRHPSRTILRRGLSSLLALALALAGLAAAPTAAQAAPYSVLVFSKTAGFRHDSIPAGIAAIAALGAANGFTVTATEDANAFTDANLAAFATVIWLSTTGDVLDANQQAAFERYIRAGGGYMGVHAASDTEYGWAWYGNLVGAYFSAHPAEQNATVKVEDPAHPSTAGLPATWPRFDEWYSFQANPRSKVHVLASLDEKSYAPGTTAMGADHPTAWCQDYDGGRSWYTGGGHTDAAFSDANFRAHLLGGIRTTAGVAGADCRASLGASFEKVTLDANTSNPMELDIAPDGRVFYIERDGRVQIIKPGTNLTVTALTLPVFSGNEDGLLGLRLDPGFASNGWVYLYYSPSAGLPRNQVSRFTVTGDTIAPSSEKVVLQVPTQRNTCCHQGGSMTFDAAGNLYLATGDNTNPFESDSFAPIDERAGRADFDSQRSAGNTNDLRGKVLRIRPQADGTYTVPSGNLFPAGTAQTRPEIYAMGFRNPFRIGVDKKTGTLYVADYGPDAQAANPNRGPEGTVEWNVVTPGNYGWPYCHGANYAYNDYTFPSGPSGAKFNCAAIVNNSPNNTGLQNLPPAIPATVDYDYSGNPLFPELGGGGAPMAGPVYRFDPALVSDRKWPAYYDGKAVFGEWNQNKLYTFQTSADGKSLVDINTLLPSMGFIRPMDLEYGPDGALYLIEWGTGFGGNNGDSGVYRIDYNSGDHAPIAVASGTPTSGPTPLAVTFSSAGSSDPDGDPITYRWTFGDGGASTAANPSHTYTAAGSYTAQLTVTDPGGRTGIASVPVTVGNTAPVVTLTAPKDGGVFAWGDRVPYTVTVTDPEDGTVDCSRVTVQFYLGHDSHAHPMQSATGCSGVMTTSLSSGHGDDANIFGVIEAVYTDNGGAGGAGAQTGRATVQLTPKRKQAEFFTATGRAPGAIGGGDAGVVRETTGDTAGGFQNLGFIEDGDYWSYTPVNLSNIASVSFRAASPGAGGRIEVRAGSPGGTLLGTATVPGTGAWQTYTDAVATISASTVSGPLFLVAKNPAGDTGQGSIMNVNWVDFTGRGVAEGGGVTVTPGSLAFGPVTQGTVSAVQTVTVTNSGTTAATVSSVTVSGQFTQTSTCPASLAAGATCTVSVRFAPTGTGAQSGTLTVSHSAAGSPATVSLSGTGTSSSANLSLGAVMSASSSNGTFVPGSANDDSTSTYWESASAFPQWLQADLGSSKPLGSITLKLPPPASWAARTQTLTITAGNDGTNWTTLRPSAGYVFDPATGNSVSMPLPAGSAFRYVRATFSGNTGWTAAQAAEFQIFGGTGTGTATLAASPASLSFGGQNTGTTSPAVTVTITNTGTAAAAISSTAVSGPFTRTTTCGATLAAGASCTASVAFAPTSTGALSGALTVAGNASNPTLTVALSGTGTVAAPASLSASPTSVTFPDQAVGGSVTRQFYVSNSGDVAASISAITIAGSGFTLGANTCGTSLAAHGTCSGNVVFTPGSAGAKSGTITVTSGNAGTLTIAVTGNGTTSGTQPVNLALFRPVTGSSVGAYGTANAVDADANSYWESPNSAFPQSITVDLGSVGALTSVVLKVPAGWGARTQTLSVLGSSDGSSFTTLSASAGRVFDPAAGNTVTVALPASTSARYVRLTVTANTAWPAAQLSDFQVMGIAGTPGNPDLALNRPVTSSGVTQTYVASNAVDGNTGTYWEGANAYPQIITVDLGSAQTVGRLVLNLPPSASWATRTQTLSVLGSTDGSSFTTLSASAGRVFDPATGNTAQITFTAASTRYVRLSFTANTGGANAQLSALSVYAS